MWTVLGIALAFLALVLIYQGVADLTLGPWSSRLVGTLLAAFAYYYVAYRWVGVELWSWQIVILAGLSVTALFYLGSAIANREEELATVILSSGALVGAAGLLVAASYLLTL